MFHCRSLLLLLTANFLVICDAIRYRGVPTAFAHSPWQTASAIWMRRIAGVGPLVLAVATSWTARIGHLGFAADSLPFLDCIVHCIGGRALRRLEQVSEILRMQQRFYTTCPVCSRSCRSCSCRCDLSQKLHVEDLKFTSCRNVFRSPT